MIDRTPVKDVTVSTLKDATYTALYFAYHVATDAIGAIPEDGSWRQATREDGDEMVRAEGSTRLREFFPLRTELPCGNVAEYQTLDDVPMTDVPCPCGDPAHWFVRYIYQKP